MLYCTYLFLLSASDSFLMVLSDTCTPSTFTAVNSALLVLMDFLRWVILDASCPILIGTALFLAHCVNAADPPTLTDRPITVQ